MLALIENNNIINQAASGGWVSLPDGSILSPAQDGWVNGAYRLAAIQPSDPIPEGKQIVSTSVEMVEGQPRYVNVLEDVPPVVTTLNPADLWRRATDYEAEAIEGAIALQPVRIRNIFRTAQTFQSNDELWPLLNGAAVGLFGAERAAELLAGS